LPFPAFFLAFPKNAQKNNAREVAKISLAFSLAFILQIQQKNHTFCIRFPVAL
jgi:hypothetical protein